MRPKTIAISLALSTGLLVSGAVAQHEKDHSDQTSGPADKNKMTMSAKMPQMITTQQEVSTLANQLLKSFAAIENEKDPIVLQKKLAEHGALLKELQPKLQGQSQMMEKMHGQMTIMGHMMGSMMGDEQKKP